MKKFFSAEPFAYNAGLTLVRIIVGLFLIYHGWELFDTAKMNVYLAWDNFKQAGNGKVLVYAGKAAELIAGVLFVLGLFTRVASLLTIGTLGYIAFVLGNGIVWYNDQHPFLFVLIAFLFLFSGPGTLSIDAALFKQKRRY
ncbi:DoxX family protein [Lacibacter luteus]|uniref:DoxX family protein n=1 Tax=Lacibacter luteus TaxID=2508719 RepID=A0A4Q1CMK8_9BACT|nr:DoxX family protein [Lacibacter luteus]RXK62260.1 DoxX family protein [Lacibacter luteus]